MAKTTTAPERTAARPRPASVARPDTARETLDRLGLIPEEDVAAMRGITVERLKNERSEGGPPYVKWGQRTFYRVAALAEWLAAQERSGTRDRQDGAARSA